ncbi:hypothetical protein niasHS_002420 [Heterodera schachtii]|uniref:Uncharacterized protein n=1 Tax=Heterodera schachtii TaxID=97005 RepID=A0ABD2KKE4_HETSC
MCPSNCFSLLFLLFCLFFVPSSVFSSFCGKSGVPYSFEVLSNGAPVLGCAQPSCVISATDSEGDFHEDSQFFTNADGQPDGFFRDGDRALKRYRHSTAPKLIANCSGQFGELSCPRKNQWVGGIEYIDHPRQPLILQCCTFEGLRFSQEVGSTTVGPGEAITGGEVVRGGRQISFDVIANVRKVSKSAEGETAGKVRYEVTVRRMNCLPDPPEVEVEFDGEVPMEVSKLLGNAKNKEVTDKVNRAGGTQQQQQNGSRKKVPMRQKSRKDGQPNAKQQQQQTASMGQRKQLQSLQQQQQVELQEVTGGEGERQQFGPNNEVAIQPNNGQMPRKNNQRPQKQQQQQHEAVQGDQQQIFNGGEGQHAIQFIEQNQHNLGTHFAEQQQNQQQFQQHTLSQSALPQQQFAGIGPQQQNGGDAASTDQSVSGTFTVTPHPLFGTMSFATLPPHSFPTFPPHSFPTLPPHSFPTLPPHSFPTLPPHSFPTLPPHSFPTFPPHTFPSFDAFTPAPAPAGLGSADGPSGAFAAPTFNAPNSGPIPLSSSDGSLGVSHLRAADANTRNGQQQPFPAFQSQRMPQMAPAMGTILAAMQGDRRPIMHPVMGLIGYSNAPQPGKKRK